MVTLLCCPGALAALLLAHAALAQIPAGAMNDLQLCRLPFHHNRYRAVCLRTQKLRSTLKLVAPSASQAQSGKCGAAQALAEQSSCAHPPGRSFLQRLAGARSCCTSPRNCTLAAGQLCAGAAVGTGDVTYITIDTDGVAECGCATLMPLLFSFLRTPACS
jgi:hypothetical protein